MLLADSGTSSVWVGEEGVRYYAHGRGLSRSGRLLEAQAELVTNRVSRLRVARRMYEMRFAGEDTEGLTMQQLRGREGARVRRIYRETAEEYGVTWSSRKYQPDDFSGGDDLNQALSAATSCLYGVVHVRSSSLWVAAQGWGSCTQVTTGRSCTTLPTCTRWKWPFLSLSGLPLTLATTCPQRSAGPCVMPFMRVTCLRGARATSMHSSGRMATPSRLRRRCHSPLGPAESALAAGTNYAEDVW